MTIIGLDGVFYPHDVLSIILNEYPASTNTINVGVGDEDEYTILINGDKYKIFDFYEEEDIIDNYNDSLFDEEFGDNKALEYIDKAKWLEDHGANSIEDCYPEYTFEELDYPLCKHRILRVTNNND